MGYPTKVQLIARKKSADQYYINFPTAVAAYSMPHLAAAKEYGWTAKPNVIPLPKWRDPEKKHRASTLDLISELRRELWADAIDRTHLTDFMSGRPSHSKSHKCKPNLASCLFAATA